MDFACLLWVWLWFGGWLFWRRGGASFQWGGCFGLGGDFGFCGCFYLVICCCFVCYGARVFALAWVWIVYIVVFGFLLIVISGWFSFGGKRYFGGCGLRFRVGLSDCWCCDLSITWCFLFLVALWVCLVVDLGLVVWIDLVVGLFVVL